MRLKSVECNKVDTRIEVTREKIKRKRDQKSKQKKMALVKKARKASSPNKK